MGENAWAAIIGPLQAAHEKYKGKIPADADEVRLALSVLPAIEAMQSPSGAVYHAPKGTFGKDPRDISSENNISLYAGLKMLLQVLQPYAAKKEVAQKIAAIEQVLKGIEGYFQQHALSKEGTLFQGGFWIDGQFKPSADFAVDVQTWGVAALGPEWVNREIGKGDLSAAYRVWSKTKERAGYSKEGVLRGVGYTDGHDILSSEWTFGAVLMVKELARYYEDLFKKTKEEKYSQWAQELLKDADTMRQGIEELKVKMPDGSVAYKYANKRYYITFGWWANPLPSLTSGWAVMLDREDPRQYYNPFVLGGGVTRGARLAGPEDIENVLAALREDKVISFKDVMAPFADDNALPVLRQLVSALESYAKDPQTPFDRKARAHMLLTDIHDESTNYLGLPFAWFQKTFRQTAEENWEAVKTTLLQDMRSQIAGDPNSVYHKLSRRRVRKLATNELSALIRKELTGIAGIVPQAKEKVLRSELIRFYNHLTKKEEISKWDLDILEKDLVSRLKKSGITLPDEKLGVFASQLLTLGIPDGIRGEDLEVTGDARVDIEHILASDLSTRPKGEIVNYLIRLLDRRGESTPAYRIKIRMAKADKTKGEFPSIRIRGSYRDILADNVMRPENTQSFEHVYSAQSAIPRPDDDQQARYVLAALMLAGIIPDKTNFFGTELSSRNFLLENELVATVEVETNIPPFSGLGGSVTLASLLIGGLADYTGRGRLLRESDLALSGALLEIYLQNLGSWQDSYFEPGLRYLVRPEKNINGLRNLISSLIPDAEKRNQLLLQIEKRTLLYYTGEQRGAVNILQKLVQGYLRRDAEFTAALKQAENNMAHVLSLLKDSSNFSADIGQLGRFLEEKSRLFNRVVPDHMTSEAEEIKSELKTKGIDINISFAGAGGGGFILVWVNDLAKKADVEAYLKTRAGRKAERMRDTTKTGPVIPPSVYGFTTQPFLSDGTREGVRGYVVKRTLFGARLAAEKPIIPAVKPTPAAVVPVAEAPKVLLAVHLPEGETRETFSKKFADFQQKALKAIGKESFNDQYFEVRFFDASTSRESIVDVTKDRNTLVLDKSLFGKSEQEISNDVGVAYAVTLNSLSARAFTLTLPFIDRLTSGRISELNEAELEQVLSVINAALEDITPESKGQILRTSIGPVLTFGTEIVRNGEDFVPDVAEKLDRLVFNAAISRTQADRTDAARKIEEFIKGLLNHLALRLDVSGKTAVTETLQSLAATRSTSQSLRLLQVDPSYRDENLANLPAQPALAGETAKTIMTDWRTFTLDAQGVPMSNRIRNLDRRAPGYFKHVLWVNDREIVARYAGLAEDERIAQFLKDHPQAEVFDKNIIFDATISEAAQFQTLHNKMVGEKFVVVAHEASKVVLGRVDKTGGKAAYLVNLATDADSTIGVIEFAAGYLMKPGLTLPTYVKLLDGVLVYLRRITPVEYQRVIRQLEEAVEAIGAAA
ncbi:MAG: hypothetical protein ACREH5_02485 [Candidatus Omnitrophota bacterium]